MANKNESHKTFEVWARKLIQEIQECPNVGLIFRTVSTTRKLTERYYPWYRMHSTTKLMNCLPLVIKSIKWQNPEIFQQLFLNGTSTWYHSFPAIYLHMIYHCIGCLTWTMILSLQNWIHIFLLMDHSTIPFLWANLYQCWHRQLWGWKNIRTTTSVEQRALHHTYLRTCQVNPSAQWKQVSWHLTESSYVLGLERVMLEKICANVKDTTELSQIDWIQSTLSSSAIFTRHQLSSRVRLQKWDFP